MSDGEQNTQSGRDTIQAGHDATKIEGDKVDRDKIIIRKVLTFGLSIGASLVLVVGLIIAFGVPEIMRTVIPLLPTATPEPTPMAFPPAESDESLIIVATFLDRSEGKCTGNDPALYLHHSLCDRIERDGLDIRIERLYEELDANTVRQTGKTYSATLVLWGEYDCSTVAPSLERVRLPLQHITDEEGAFLAIANPERIQINKLTDLSTLGSYITLFTLGADRYAAEEYDTAWYYLTSTINAVPEDEESTTQPDEAYFLRGLVNSCKKDFHQAIVDYTYAITLEYAPLNRAYYNRGLAYNALQQHKAAIDDFNTVIQTNPEDTQAYYNRGLAYNALQQHKAAIDDFKQVLELNDDPALQKKAEDALRELDASVEE